MGGGRERALDVAAQHHRRRRCGAGAGAIGVRLRNEDTAQAHTFALQSFQATTIPPPPPPATIASDSFQRTLASGWGNADTGGWWTVVGSPWNWSTRGARERNRGAAGEERAYLSSFTVQDVDVVEKVVLPKCNTNKCDAFVLGRYSPAYSPTYYRVGVVQGAGGDIFLRAQRATAAISRVISTPGSLLPTGRRSCCASSSRARTRPSSAPARGGQAPPNPRAGFSTPPTTPVRSKRPGCSGCACRTRTRVPPIPSRSRACKRRERDPGDRNPNPTGAAHWLYVVNDGMVYVYDIDNNHTLVKQFPIPEQGKRGVMVDPGRKLLYVMECGPNDCAGSHGSLIAYDLVHDNVAWIANYSFGVDQAAITPDGSTITCRTGKTPPTASIRSSTPATESHRHHHHRDERPQHDRFAGRHPGVPHRLERQQLQLRTRGRHSHESGDNGCRPHDQRDPPVHGQRQAHDDVHDVDQHVRFPSPQPRHRQRALHGPVRRLVHLERCRRGRQPRHLALP